MLVNLTPHPVTLRCVTDGLPIDIVLPPDARGPARISEVPGGLSGAVSTADGDSIPVYSAPRRGAVEGLPTPEAGVTYIVSGLVAAACGGRADVMSPGTGPGDGPIREGGRIVAVTRLIRAPAGGLATAAPAAPAAPEGCGCTRPYECGCSPCEGRGE